jgi:hypothetical protein
MTKKQRKNENKLNDKRTQSSCQDSGITFKAMCLQYSAQLTLTSLKDLIQKIQNKEFKDSWKEPTQKYTKSAFTGSNFRSVQTNET